MSDDIQGAAKAALSMAKYFDGVQRVAAVLKEIGSLENYQAEAEKRHAEKQDELKAVMAEVDEANQKLLGVTDQLNQAREDRDAAKAEAEKIRADAAQAHSAKQDERKAELVKAVEAQDKALADREAQLDADLQSRQDTLKSLDAQVTERQEALATAQAEVEAFKAKL